MRCVSCEKKRMQRRRATVEKPYHFIESGLENVYLAGIYVHRCDGCNEELPEIPNIAQLHDEIGKSLVAKPALLSPQEIRFLRKNLGLKAAEFAEFLGTTPVSVSRWETGEQDVSKENDRLIRYFYLRHKEEATKRRIKEAPVGELGPAKPMAINVRVSPKGVSSELVEC